MPIETIVHSVVLPLEFNHVNWIPTEVGDLFVDESTRTPPSPSPPSMSSVIDKAMALCDVYSVTECGTCAQCTYNITASIIIQEHFHMQKCVRGVPQPMIFIDNDV